MTFESGRRVVVVGSRGFIGKSLIQKLEELCLPYLAISRNDINLTDDCSHESLATLLENGDQIVFSSAVTPSRSADDVALSMKMVSNLQKAVLNVKDLRIILISSDSVYGDRPGSFSEESLCAPNSFHGLAQLGREMAISQLGISDHCILRLCAVYGSDDTHNSYGPNRFMRHIFQNSDISLFGEGLNIRDHVYIADVVNLLTDVILSKFRGVLNVASGYTYEFRQVAKICKEVMSSDLPIRTQGTEGQIIRKVIDISKLQNHFPKFTTHDLPEGLTKWAVGYTSHQPNIH